jgi:charged multivesicular body protein 4A/B
MFSFFSRATSNSKIDNAVDASDDGSSPRQSMPTQPSMSASPVPSEPTSYKDNGQPTVKSFSDCHDAYCNKYGVTRATFLQVLRNEANIKDDFAPWPLPPRSTVMVSAKEVADALRNGDEESTAQATDTIASTGSSAALLIMTAVTSPLKWTSRAVSSMLRDRDDEGEKWEQEDDEAVCDDSSETAFEDGGVGKGYNSATPIVNFVLVQLAIQQLQLEIDGHASQSFEGDTPIILGTSEWNLWATKVLSKVETANKIALNTIPATEKHFLLQVLEELKVAKTIQRKEKTGAADLIVLYPSSMIPTKQEKPGEVPEQLQVLIALWDLQASEKVIERQIKDWSEKADKCAEEAVKQSRANKKSVALHFLRKKKRLENEISTATQKLEKIEHAKSAIENSQSNKMVMGVLADSTTLLKNLRKEHCIEDVDDVMLDFQQELEDQKELNEAMAASNDIAMGGSISDEDLLRELEGLSALSLDELEMISTPSQPGANQKSSSVNDTIELPALPTSDERQEGSREKNLQEENKAPEAAL